MQKIITHDGAFHADEVTAVALLLKYHDEKLLVIRTRDLSEAEPNSIIVDQGGKVEGSIEHGGTFDHHQGGIGAFNDVGSSSMASAGLILTHLPLPPDLKESLYKSFIYSVDRQDNNGIVAGVYSFSSFIGSMNADDIYSQSQTVRFMQAVDIVRDLLERTEARHNMYVSNVAYVQEKCATMKDDILVLDRYIPDLLKVLNILALEVGIPKFSRAIFPDRAGFKILALPLEYRTGGEIKRIIAPIGDDDFIFVHKAGFIAGSKSLESALQIAKLV